MRRDRYQGKYAYTKEDAEKQRRYRPRFADWRNSSRFQEIRARRTYKVIKYIVQFLLVAVILFVVVRSTFFPPRYKAYNEGKSGTIEELSASEGGSFIAISYFGVEKFDSESRTLITQKRLQEHIDALLDAGYVTITQDDILDYYFGVGSLPEKALFILFEDGRRDTAVFAQNVLQRANYKATVLTYGDKFEMKDGKFLSAKDLKVLLKSSYWEVGTNGYRLAYINVFDRYGNYFGHLNSNEFVTISKYLVRDYNHYLMDFLRDEDRVREETIEEMQQRILADYESMQYIYNENIGYLPKLYTLMHSNTGMFGTDPLVSVENRKHLTEIFAMNFNREGSCLNTQESSVYDLTRMQPQANWYTNHLLMRIGDDIDEEMNFVVGDEAEAGKWNTDMGAAEFRKNAIVLTSEPNSYGRMTLKNSRYDDFFLSVTLDGNVMGNQGIYLRADRSLENGLYVGIENNVLVVRAFDSAVGSEVYSLDLFEFDGGSTQSVEENEKEGIVARADAVLQYDDDYQKLQDAQGDIDTWEDKDVTELAEGGEGYVPTIDLLDRGKRLLELTLSGTSLSISIDGKPAIKNLKVPVSRKGTIALESSALIQEKYSQRNLADDVYDAVYTDLTIRNPGNEQDVYYAYKYTGLQKIGVFFVDLFEKTAVFFTDHF